MDSECNRDTGLHNGLKISVSDITLLTDRDRFLTQPHYESEPNWKIS